MSVIELAELNERYVTNAEGQRIAVILDMEIYQKILAALEDMLETTLFDAATAGAGEAIPFEQAVTEIERDRPAE